MTFRNYLFVKIEIEKNNLVISFFFLRYPCVLMIMEHCDNGIHGKCKLYAIVHLFVTVILLIRIICCRANVYMAV